jgi:hypothetical protein
MHIVLDKNKMQLSVICGILENYKPTPEIEEIHAKVADLQHKMELFMSKIIEPALFDINKRIADENAKHIKQVEEEQK